MSIHVTAIIDKGAKIDEGVVIGPYCVIGRNVRLSKGVTLHSHVCIEGFTSIGDNTTIYPFASIGHPPQDLKYNGENSTLKIGSNNIIREYVTIHPGTKLGEMKTTIGNNCLFMIGAHIAHDCKVGNNVIMANNATLGGHVKIGDYAIIGGLAAIHQYVRIGDHAIIGGVSAVVEDVIPYGSAVGDRATLTGINAIGMKRKEIPNKTIHAIRKLYRMIFEDTSINFEQRLNKVGTELKDFPEVIKIIDFLKSPGKRGICLPKKTKI